MKNIHLCVIAFLIAFVRFGPNELFAQNQSFHSRFSEHYLVYSDESEMRSFEVSRKMEAALTLFNDYLHFNLSSLPVRLKVRIFKEKKDFDTYLQNLISETRADFVFISYTDLSRSEMVGFMREEEEFNASLLHYGFIQYLNAFIPATPLWLEEGMAAYLEYSKYDPVTESFTWQPNFVWLDPLKKILRGLNGLPGLTISELITIDKAKAHEKIDLFYPSAWGLIYFLMNSPEKRFNRIIWDSISVLDANLSLSENSRAVKEKAFSFVKEDEFQRTFVEHILSLKTFNDMVREGIELYSNHKLGEAETSFIEAIELRSENYIPYYYLGLIQYEKKEYQEAQNYYNQARDLGIDNGLINYALGVNAFADKRYDLAEEYLKSSKESNPETYADKVDSLLKRIEFLR